jgi:hypothetical protein
MMGLLQVVSDKEDDKEEEGVEKYSGDPSQTIKHAPLQDIPKGVTIDTLSWVPKYYTFRVRGIVQE